jgi:HK97 family phage portal protein
MSIRSRLIKFLAVKQNPVAQLILASLPKDGLWTKVNYKDLAEAGYKNCMTVYACTRKITDSAAGMNWQAQDANGGDIPNHPVLKLLQRPNPMEGKRQFMTAVLSHLILTGNAYIYQASGGGKPRFLYTLRPDRIKVLPGQAPELVRGYRYTVDGRDRDFDLKEVLHIKLFNPLDDFYGMGPIEAAAKGIDIWNLSATWNAAIAKNDMRPAGAFTTEGTLTLQQLQLLKDQITENYQGSANAGAPLLLHGGLKYEAYALSPKELDWTNSNRENARSICAVMGVPSQLLGDTEASTYSNYKEARAALYTDTILPLMNYITDALDNWLMPMFGGGATLAVDVDAIDALQENRGEKFAYINASDCLTINEKREALGYEPIGAEGDVVMVSFARIPITDITRTVYLNPETSPDGNSQDGNQTEGEDANAKARRGKAKKAHFWDAPEKKLRLWMAFDNRVKAREKTFELLAKEYLRRQAESIKSKIDGVTNLAGLTPSDLLDKKKEVKRYEEVFGGWYMDHYVRAHAAGIRATKGELFDDADFKADNKPTSWVNSMTAAQRAKLKKAIHDSGTKVNETAIDKIENLIEQANAENWTVNELADKIAANVSDWDKWRAQLWARTESAKVDNMGQLEGYRDTEFVTEKVWICAQVPESRDWHVDADGQTVKLDEDFRVGDEDVEFPGDGSARNVCNCLCSMAPKVGG